MLNRIQITFQRRPHDSEIGDLARREASRLLAMDPRITWCHVVIGYTHGSSMGIGGTYVKVLFALPGCTMVVRHKPDGPWDEDDPAAAVALAFESAVRMLDGYSGRRAERRPSQPLLGELHQHAH